MAIIVCNLQQGAAYLSATSPCLQGECVFVCPGAPVCAHVHVTLHYSLIHSKHRCSYFLSTRKNNWLTLRWKGLSSVENNLSPIIPHLETDLFFLPPPPIICFTSSCPDLFSDHQFSLLRVTHHNLQTPRTFCKWIPVWVDLSNVWHAWHTVKLWSLTHEFTAIVSCKLRQLWPLGNGGREALKKKERKKFEFSLWCWRTSNEN